MITQHDWTLVGGESFDQNAYSDDMWKLGVLEILRNWWLRNIDLFPYTAAAKGGHFFLIRYLDAVKQFAGICNHLI